MARVTLLWPITEAHGIFDGALFVTRRGQITLRSIPPYLLQPKHAGVKPTTCACQAFQAADLMYQDFDQATKDKWRHALKKPAMSAYDLWMSECLTCFNAGRNAPDTPSISGGFSTGKVLCDSLILPPDS